MGTCEWCVMVDRPAVARIRVDGEFRDAAVCAEHKARFAGEAREHKRQKRVVGVDIRGRAILAK